MDYLSIASISDSNIEKEQVQVPASLQESLGEDVNSPETQAARIGSVLIYKPNLNSSRPARVC